MTIDHWPKSVSLALAGALSCVCATAQQSSLAASMGLMVYPSEGQSAATQTTDEAACYQWAHQATGVDPMTAARAATQAPTQPDSAGTGAAAGRGALRGAAGGALIADIANGGTNEGAWAGAVLGGLRGTKEHQMRNQATEQRSAADAQAQIGNQLATFNKGFAACLEGKHYTVK